MYKNKEGTICLETIPDDYYVFDALNKIIEKCHISCKSCDRGPENNNTNCLLCNENFEKINNNCLYKYNYYFDQSIDKIIYLLSNQFCPENLPYEIIKTRECVESCTNEEFINNICKVNYFSEKNMDLITNKLRSLINETTDSDFDVIINGNNIIYEVTSSSTNKEHHNISSIDFGECEKILKKHYSIDYLLVFKMDIKLNDSYPTVIDYEVYSPINKTKLDLSLCENSKIDIYVPMHLDNYSNNLYDSMNKYGFDILDKNDLFYNDICTPFTSDDGTDLVLSDRQSNYFNEDLILCETGCTYDFYNSTNGKAKCQCPVKKEMTKIKTISYDKINIDSFFDIKTFSNIELIKCFKLAFSKNGFIDNYGSIIIVFMTTIFICLIIIYLLYQKQLISRIIRLALKVNNLQNPPRIKGIHFTVRNKSKKDVFNYNKHDNQSKQIQQSQTIRHLFDTNSQNNHYQNKKSSKKLTLQIRNVQHINLINNENFIIKKEKKEKKEHNKISPRKKDSKKSKEIAIYQFKEQNNSKITEKGNKISGKKVNVHLPYYEKYNDLELNDLDYKKAIKIDKRTFIQYYWSLLKNKHIILCIFLAVNDYNLVLIKIGLFIFSFCLYFTVNALFFTDKTMHKIYEDKGIFNFIYQFPQIFYSSLITSFLNMFIKSLALSGKRVIQLKKIKNKEEAYKKSFELYKNLMIRFNLFYFISLFLLVFFWYYISTFCAVYKNTQIILIENTLTCFILTLMYPFILNLLPGIFRIPALKASNKDKENLYKIGKIISLI